MPKPRKLTHPDAWNTYAGGTFAAPDRHAYDSKTTIGTYSIQPIGHRHNSNRHMGYRVHFINDKGKITAPGTGLWNILKGTELQPGLCTLPEARRLCQQHLEANNGEVITDNR